MLHGRVHPRQGLKGGVPPCFGITYSIGARNVSIGAPASNNHPLWCLVPLVSASRYNLPPDCERRTDPDGLTAMPTPRDSGACRARVQIRHWMTRRHEDDEVSGRFLIPKYNNDDFDQPCSVATLLTTGLHYARAGIFDKHEHCIHTECYTFRLDFNPC